jgi:hypothetical protein
MEIKQNNLKNTIATATLLQQKFDTIVKNDVSLKNKNFVNIDTLLKELFSNLANNTNSKSHVLNLLKQLPVFKNFEGLPKEIMRLLDIIQNNKQNTKEIDNLKNAIIDIKKIDTNSLKNSLNKSGVFLENYIKNFIHNQSSKEEFVENIKSTLLKLSESPTEEIKNQANKIISQLEYFSLFSLVNDSNKIPLSFDWNDLKEGDIEFYEPKNQLKTCQINLDLQSLGEIKINLSYDKDENINIAFLCKEEDSKECIRNNFQTLRSNLSNNNLKLQSLGVHDLKLKESLDEKFKQSVSNHYGVDIKV